MIELYPQVGIFVWKENDDQVLEPRETTSEAIFADRRTGPECVSGGYWMLNYRVIVL
jgi:hypothetical protein